MVGQAYLVLNTTAVVGAAFWMGVQWSRLNAVTTLVKELKEEKRSDPPVGELRVALENLKGNMDQLSSDVKEDIDRLTQSFEELRKSIFVQAVSLSRKQQLREDEGGGYIGASGR